MELFFFDRSVLDSLPRQEGVKYQEMLRKLSIPAGRPFFLAENGLPLRELDGLCSYLLDPRRASGRTWATYANQIAVFLRFLEKQGKDWKQVTRSELNLYYSVRTTGEFQTSQKLKARSWNIAKTAIVHLYEYGLDAGHVAELPFKYRKSRTAFGGKSSQTSDLGAKFTPERVNFISIQNYKNVWRPRVANRRNSQRNSVMTDLLITVGLRISEAVGLQTHQIPDPDDTVYAGRKSVPIRVQGKGSKARTVRIPKRIVRALHFYIAEDREDAVVAYRKKHGSKSQPPKHLFLSEDGSTWSARTVQDSFKKISDETGIKLTPHGCRHTFAVFQLEAMIKRMAKNLKELRERGADAYRQVLYDPLRELQRLLGHSSITSTYIYLDFLEESEALVDESLSDWVNWESENAQ